MAAVGMRGLKKMERKLKKLVKQGGPRIGKAAMSGMVTPLKTSIRRGVRGTTASSRMKKATNATVGHRLLKPTLHGEHGLKVGFGVGAQLKGKKGNRQPTAKAKKAAARSKSAKTGVGIAADNVFWAVLGTGEGTKSKGMGPSGAERRHKSGKLVGSTKPYFRGVVEAAITRGTPIAMAAGAARAKIALRKQAQKIKRSP